MRGRDRGLPAENPPRLLRLPTRARGFGGKGPLRTAPSFDKSVFWCIICQPTFVEWIGALMSRTYVALDLETTGLDPARDTILEIGVVRFRGEKVLDTWSSLVNPQRRIPYQIQQLTGITQEEADGAPSLFSLLASLRQFAGRAPLVGHSIQFDLAFLARHGLFADNAALDTFELASILLPHMARYSLQRLAKELGISALTHHRALDDAHTTARLFQVLHDQAKRLNLATIQEIRRLGAGSNWPLTQFFEDVEREQSRTLFTTSIGQQLLARGVLNGRGSAQLFYQREEVEPPLQPAAQPRPLDTEALAAMLDEGGAFSRQFPGYEHRPQQVEMLRAVARAFNQHTHLLVEAGAGTGKSIAYLLPAAYFAATNSEHVVISTNTINLQDQLYHKDIPDLQRLLGIEFRAALLKGRRNYLCLRRLEALRRRGQLSPTVMRVLAKILVWLPSTLTGDRAEVFLPSAGERAVWGQVCSDPEACLGERCGYRQEGQCFFYEARRRAERAHLIVVNHALLLADIAVENRVLPDYGYLIIDEAHNLEDSVTRQLSFEADRQGLEEMLTSISQRVAPGRYVGLLTQLSFRLQPLLGQTLHSQATERIREVQQKVEGARSTLYDLFNGLRACLNDHRRPAQSYDQRLRLTGGMRAQPAWDEVEIAGDNFTLRLAGVVEGLRLLLEGLENLTECDLTSCEDLLQQLHLQGGQLYMAHEQLRPLLVEPRENTIYWATIHSQDQHISLHTAPLHVGELVEQYLFHPKRMIVLTSATLRAEGSFDYITERLHAWDAEQVALDSPFDYPSSTLLFLPADIPEPNQPHHQKRAEEALTLLCRAAGGRTLALFTSYSQLHNTARAIRRTLGEADISVFVQGQGTSRRQLLENFRTTPRSVLLGTSSFWEGVDVMGEALSCLVIAKLPFAVPTDPIFAARGETFDDPFRQYAVPQAILRFRQGFGRLIRSKTDRGIVLVLDRRVGTKFYGQAFLDSLPECTIRRGPIAQLPQVAREWLDRGP